MQCEWNYGQSFFIMLSLIPTSILLSSWAVARFIWLPWIEHLNSLPEPKISYEKRYLITDDDIECLNDTKDFYLKCDFEERGFFMSKLIKQI